MEPVRGVPSSRLVSKNGGPIEGFEGLGVVDVGALESPCIFRSVGIVATVSDETDGDGQQLDFPVVTQTER